MWQILVFLTLAIIIYYIFFVPVHYTKNDNFDDKKSAINRARRLRKVGKNIPPPFPNGWYALASSCEIKPGTAKDINCLGENFVVFRSAVTNEVYILDAYCTHMGANLGVGGIVSGECISCPFHHWKFSGKDGSLVDIPYSDDVKSVEKLAKMRKWISREVNSLIFIWYHAESEEPSWEVPLNSKIENGTYWLHGTNEFTVHCHIQDIPENGADRAHLAAVHSPNMFAGSDLRSFRDKILSFGCHIWDAQWNALSEDKKHVAKISLEHYIQLWFFKFFRVDASVLQIGPGYVVLVLKSVFGNVLILQTVTPIEPLKQRLSHYFYAPRYLGPFLKFAIYGETVNVARDVMVWNYKEFVKNPILPKEEKQIKLFRNWYSQFYSENSKNFQEAYSNLNW